MALQSQNIQFPLFKGLNNKSDNKQTSIGEMLTIENAVFKNTLKYQKRNGYSALTRTVLTSPFTFTFQKLAATISNGSWCASFKDEKIMGDGFGLYSYSESDAKWSYKGRCESARTTLTPIYQLSNTFPPQASVGNINTQEHPDSCINTTSAQALYAWESYSQPSFLLGTYLGLQYALFDNNTNQEIFNGILANTCSRPKCINIGSLNYLFYFDSGDGKIKARSITSTGASAATDIVTNINTTTPNYDIFVNNSLIYIAYNGTVNTVKVASFNSALTNQASVSKAEIASNGICLFSDAANNIWVAYNNATDTKAFIMDSTLVTTVLAATVVEAAVANVLNITGIHDGTQGIIFYDKPGTYYLTQSVTTVSADYVQPAVGSTVAASTTADASNYVGQVIKINTGGFYYVTAGTTTALTIKNLGTTGNAAPGATITAPQSIIPTTGARSQGEIRYATLTVGGSASAKGAYCYKASITSRAFLYSSVAHVMLGYESNSQPTHFLTSLYDVNTSSTNNPPAHFVARIASNFAGGNPTKSILSSINNYATGFYKSSLTTRVLNVERTINNISFALFYNGINAVDISLAPTQVSKQAIAENLHIASGSLMMYDGLNVVEHGFHTFPPELIQVSSGSSGRILAGLYGYVVVYSWTDNQGQVHRSAPSSIITTTLTGTTSSVGLFIEPLSLTAKNNCIIEVYRTAANGSIFYRIDSNYLGSSSFPLLNEGLSSTTKIQFTDTFADTEITGNQQLYTTGEIENIIAPSPRALSVYKNRLLLIPADDRTTNWYSKQVIPGSPAELNDSFVQNTDQSSGPIISTVQLDDKEILFKGKNIYYVVGSGPAASGSDNDFSDPTLIATDVGLVDLASIIQMPLGIMFKSEKGVYLLDRSMAVQYIGSKVQDYNSLTVISSQLIANVNQVRFMLSSGQAIVYDYFVNEWSVFTNHSCVDTMISGSIFYYLRSDGTVLKETDGVYSDNGSFISMKVKTGWLSFAGLQGFQRIWQMLLLGEYISAHNLQLDVSVDFVSAIVQTKTFNPSANPYQWRLNFTIQKCETMQVTIQDVFTTTLGESYSLSNLAFDVGVKKGLNKIGQARSG
jgi:hypothetical protein